MDRKLIAAIAVICAIAGCGGSGRLSRADFVARANAVCRQRVATISSMQKRYARDFRGFVAAAAPIASRSVDDLRAIKPPSSLQGAYDRFLAGEQAQVSHIRAIVAAQKAGRSPDAHESIADIHRQAKIARSLALDACV